MDNHDEPGGRVKRANLLMVAGAVLLVVGLALVWLLGRDDGGTASEPRLSVLVARDDLSAGQTGEELVAQGKVSIEQVAASEAEPGALTSTTAMAGTVMTGNLAEGDQVLAGSVRDAVLRSAAITIPDDKQALAVTLDATAGGAGYAGIGDRINLYTNIDPDAPGAPRAPFTRLVLSDVEVLDISSQITPQRAQDSASGAAREASQTITLLLAVDADEAETAIFAVNQNTLWITVLPEGQGPSRTDGVDYETGYLEGS